MKDENFEKMLKMVLQHEGGYVNNPNDKGGETNKGITHITYDYYRKNKGLQPRSVKYITEDEVKDIYYNNYYKASGADKLENPQLSAYVFDTAVNMGVSRAQEILKQSNGNLDTFENLRRAKYQEFAKNPKQAEFLPGWLNRVSTTKKFAKENLSPSIYNTDEGDSKNNSSSNNNKKVSSEKENSNSIYTHLDTGSEQNYFKTGIEYNDYYPNFSKNINSPTTNPFDIQIKKENPWDNIPMANPWESLKSQPTGHAAPVQNVSQKPYTPDDIGKMSQEEFNKNEDVIMEQLRNGKITNQSSKIDYSNYKNPKSGNNRVFTKEDIDNMSTSEFSKYENEIMAQMNSIGIPNKNDLSANTKTREKEKSNSKSSNGDGKWVTINGNHVFIEK